MRGKTGPSSFEELLAWQREAEADLQKLSDRAVWRAVGPTAGSRGEEPAPEWWELSQGLHLPCVGNVVAWRILTLLNLVDVHFVYGYFFCLLLFFSSWVLSDSVTPWAVVCQAPLSMGFSRQEYWSGLLFPSPGDLPNPGIEPASPALPGGSFTAEPPGSRGPFCWNTSQELISLIVNLHAFVFWLGVLSLALMKPRLGRGGGFNRFFVKWLFFPAW